MFLLIQKSVEQHHLSLVSDYLTIFLGKRHNNGSPPQIRDMFWVGFPYKNQNFGSLARFGLSSNIFADSYIHPFGDV